MQTYTKYADPATLTEWRPTGGPGEAITIASFRTAEGNNPLTVTLKAEASTELSKSGLRRVLMKVSTTVPTDECGCGSSTRTGGYPTKAGANLPISAHVVVTAPAQALRFSKDNPNDSSFGKVVEAVLRHLMAIVGASYYTKDPDMALVTDPNSPVAAGLLGAEPLDVVSGAYGAE